MKKIFHSIYQWLNHILLKARIDRVQSRKVVYSAYPRMIYCPDRQQNIRFTNSRPSTRLSSTGSDWAEAFAKMDNRWLTTIK